MNPAARRELGGSAGIAESRLARVPDADLANRRVPEHPAVLAAELRGALVSNATAHGSDVPVLVSEDAPRFLKAELLLILQWTHPGDASEPVMKAGNAHPGPSSQVVDSKPLAKVTFQPGERDANAFRLPAFLRQSV